MCVCVSDREINNKSHNSIIWMQPLSCLPIIQYSQSIIIAFVLCNSALCYCASRPVIQLKQCNLGIAAAVFVVVVVVAIMHVCRRHSLCLCVYMYVCAGTSCRGLSPGRGH